MKSNPSVYPDDNSGAPTLKAQHTPTPWHTVDNFDGRHHVVPILASWECDGNEPYHPLIVQVLMGRGHADKATALATAAHIVRCVNSHDALLKFAQFASVAGGFEIQRAAQSVLARL